MANLDWNAMQHQTHADRPDVVTLGGSVAVPLHGIDAATAAAGVASSRAVSTGVLVMTRTEAGTGGCGSAAGGFGSGGLLALPVLLAAALLRRRGVARARRAGR